MEKSRNGLTYRDAGVDIDAGNELVRRIGPLAAATRRPGVVGGLGGFGAVFDPRAAGYEDPLLVAATDGVGTKLKIAIEAGRHDTVGIDLVAMCVNDLIVQGAEPLFFLDYFGTGALDPDAAADVVAGIAEGCQRAGCALIGGETAELPGLYAAGDYDLAGFAVGAVERSELLTGETITPGDLLIGIASDGVHSNGYSLVRRIVEHAGLDWRARAPFAEGASLGQALLAPTRIYVKSCRAALDTGGVHGFAHITGGGIVENLPRIFPPGVAARIDGTRWDMPAVFRWLAASGDVAPTEMWRTFNCGIGMIVVAAADRAAEVTAALTANGERAFEIGDIVAADEDEPAVRLANADTPFA